MCATIAVSASRGAALQFRRFPKPALSFSYEHFDPFGSNHRSRSTLDGILKHIEALATDYDETIATNGRVDSHTLAVLTRFRASGRKLILNTGRTLPDLAVAFPDLDFFDLIIVENGAVMYDPHARRTTLLAGPPPKPLLDAFHRRGVPLLAGHVILETWSSYATAVDHAIEESGVPRELTYNKSSVLINPPGVHKGHGLLAALKQLGISPANTAGIGDAENDHELLAASGVAVAVPHAISALKKQAHHILSPSELVSKILTPIVKPASDRPA
jgi:hydroxymethylpyrimidine pyrophosphatase-like HAD family hydrolase